MESSLPPFVAGVLAIFSSCATMPTVTNLRIISLGFIICTGRKTITNLIRVAGQMIDVHPSTLSRVFSLRKINGWVISKNLTELIIGKFLNSNEVFLIVDDTFMHRYGSKVFGRCRHRDAVRSSKRLNAHDWGHKWIVLCILLKSKYLSKPFALPIMLALYKSKGWNFKHGRKHRTPIQILKILIYKLHTWFPQISFTLIGDKSYGSFELAIFCNRMNITLISRFHPNAVLIDPTKKRRFKAGRPTKYGLEAQKPSEIVTQKNPGKNLKVRWYGKKEKWLETCCEKGFWKRRKEVLPVKWVYSRNPETGREEYYYSNRPDQTKKYIIEAVINRWPIETMFEECKQHLAIKGMKGYKEKTVLSTVPGCFLLYTLTILLFLSMPTTKQKTVIHWQGKTSITFTDMLTVVRREIWKEWIFSEATHRAAFMKLPIKLKNSLIYGLAPCD